MKKTFASLLMVLGLSAAVCAAEVSEIAAKALEKGSSTVSDKENRMSFRRINEIEQKDTFLR